MPDQTHGDVVERQTFHASLTLPEARTTPIIGLFQRPYTLSEANFLRLKSRPSILVGIGGGFITFGLASGLPLVAKLVIAASRRVPPSIDSVEAWISAAALVVGLVSVIAGWFSSRERRRVLREIEKHFRDNPALPEIRGGAHE